MPPADPGRPVANCIRRLPADEAAGVRTFHLHRELWLPLPPERLFPFFAAPENLQTITPPFLDFRIVACSDAAVRAGTIIDYRHPQHLTAVGAIEHFGISLRALGPTNLIHVRWMRNGQPATVNGQVPNPNGNPTPATQPIMPTITTDTTVTGTGDGVVVTVINNDPNQAIWIQRSGRLYQGVVTLESLMTNNPVVTESAPAPAAVDPSDVVYLTSPFVGTFYRSPSPDAPPFVNTGSSIREGQTLCIVEAMKLMNEIESEVAGKVAELFVQNAQPVEFGQPLFRIEPA